MWLGLGLKACLYGSFEGSNFITWKEKKKILVLQGLHIVENNSDSLQYDCLLCFTALLRNFAVLEWPRYQERVENKSMEEGPQRLLISLVPRPPPFCVLQFAFSIIHGSGRALFRFRVLY